MQTQKVNSASTVAEQKQILGTCIHKLEEINVSIMEMYPKLSTNLPLTDYNNEELIASELKYDMCSLFVRFGDIIVEVIRKETDNEQK